MYTATYELKSRLGVMKQWLRQAVTINSRGVCRLGILQGCWRSSCLSCCLRAIIGSSGLFRSLSQIMLVSLRSLQLDRNPYSSTPACLAWLWMRLCSSWKQGFTDDDSAPVCMIPAIGPSLPQCSTEDYVLLLLQIYANPCTLCSVSGSSSHCPIKFSDPCDTDRVRSSGVECWPWTANTLSHSAASRWLADCRMSRVQ